MADLSVTLGPLRLKNPVLTASGTFGYGREYEDFVNLNRLGGIITKSITRDPRAGNPPPRITEVPGGMLNSIGLANVGMEAFVREKLPYLRNLETQIIVNVAGNSVEEYEAVVSRLDREKGIHAFELNLSCPNVKEGGLTFGKSPEAVFKIVERVRLHTNRPLIVKLTPNVTAIGDLAQAAVDGGADILSAINTVVGMAVDVSARKSVLGKMTGGFSGPALKSIALAKVFEVVRRVSVPVIGIGGIFSAEDVLEFLLVGASAVQIGTANFVDPAISEKVVNDLEIYCEKQGIEDLEEIIGKLDVDGAGGDGNKNRL
ncbi:dihydroorotate dehydrogenase B (NAD(+)), catalytic subunit [bacterium BMS3Abin05]|nr:dihydroorotate dehydrogenase B (NAD(+)), catalytic subunit [bacterium BMS3Abin05]HDZ12500.1 dihydroorotate dehydrogenase [Bacteroidota bacterium]